MRLFGLDQPELGKLIDSARRNRGLTIDEVARKTGYDERTIRNIISGKGARARTIQDVCECVCPQDSADNREVQAAAEELGGYTFESTKILWGDYLFVRPSFSNPTNLNAYIIHIRWEGSKATLVFEERSREDAKYTQSGSVYLPPGQPFFHLLSTQLGAIRMYTVSRPDGDGLLRGMISTVGNPKGAIYIPVAAPIFLRRLQSNENPQLGFITPENPAYLNYQEILASVTAEEFGTFAMNLNPTERRRGLEVVSS
jgi:transcriptional regulator with XRE-family HTH domain